MRKKSAFMGVMLLIAAMVLSVGGTCLAQDTVTLEGAYANIDDVYWPMAYSNLNTGASAYLLTGTLVPADWGNSGVSLIAVSNERTNATNSEMLAQAITTGVLNTELTGATPMGGPALLSGTTSNMILYVIAPANHGVGDTNQTGGTLYGVDAGSGAVRWNVGIPMPNVPAVASSGPVYDNFMFTANGTIGTTPYCIAPVVVDWDAGGNGASIYGVSGVSPSTEAGGDVPTTNAGVSIWHRTSPTGALSGDTAFHFASGISVIGTAPVISGNSLFIIAPYTKGITGVSIVQFDRNLQTYTNPNYMGAGIGVATVNAEMTAGGNDRFIPTPCATGNSIFVTDWNGGVSIYYAANCTLLRTVPTYFSTTGVTAGPVTNTERIVIPFTSSVSCFDITHLSSNSPAWTFEFEQDPNAAGHRYEIWADPVISNNYVWITVRDVVAGDVKIHRFNVGANDELAGHVVVGTRPDMYAGPIVAGTRLWMATANPTVERVSQSGFADGENYWVQAKADVERTGNNTREEEVVAPTDTYQPGSSGGCFISTVR
jgi:hypothetical protein